MTDAAGLALGYLADRWLGDPQRHHPVAGFGQLATAVERRLYADSRWRGALFTLTLVGATVACGALVERLARGRVAGTAVTAAVTWAVLGGRSLEREALAVHQHLDQGDLAAARRRMRNLVGRDTAELGPDEIARAVVESLAENTSDAVVGALLWGAVAGVPGLVGYRAINTLDAMVGHHNARYENFGWASARLDDVVNWPAARLSGLLVLAVEPGQADAGWRAWRQSANRHPSPNAGVVEASFAGVLGVRLGGVNRYYGNRVEHRALMGNGRPVVPDDVPKAAQLAVRVGVAAMLAAMGLAQGARLVRRAVA